MNGFLNTANGAGLLKNAYDSAEGKSPIHDALQRKIAAMRAGLEAKTADPNDSAVSNGIPINKRLPKGRK